MIHLFCDGSYRSKKPRYSFAAYKGDNCLFLEAGYAAPRLHGFPGRIRSNDCEIYAALQALNWVSDNLPEERAVLFTDAESIAVLATSRPADPYLRFLQSRMSLYQVSVRMIRSHESCEYHRFVDRLSKSGVCISRTFSNPIVGIPRWM